MLVMGRDFNNRGRQDKCVYGRRLAGSPPAWLEVGVPQGLTIALAVEKVLFRLALLEGGSVPIVRAFLELPLALEVLEHEADKCSDGAAILKDEWGEFLGYSFPELQS